MEILKYFIFVCVHNSSQVNDAASSAKLRKKTYAALVLSVEDGVQILATGLDDVPELHPVKIIVVPPLKATCLGEAGAHHFGSATFSSQILEHLARLMELSMKKKENRK